MAVVDQTGAGDAFAVGLILAHLEGLRSRPACNAVVTASFAVAGWGPEALLAATRADAEPVGQALRRGAVVKRLCEHGDEVARPRHQGARGRARNNARHARSAPPGWRDHGIVAGTDCPRGRATPATIGIIGGAIRIGLTRTELEQLDDTERRQESISATSPRPCHRSARLDDRGGHHVHASGIRVFATGGIGGVHRDASESGDVSADLTALSRIPVAVVSAGAKAILDLPRTVEMLETLGVPVFGFRTDEFPAFYRRSTGLPVDRRYDSITELASAVRLHLSRSRHGRADCQSHSECRRNGVGASTIARSTRRCRRLRRAASAAAR